MYSLDSQVGKGVLWCAVVYVSVYMCVCRENVLNSFQKLYYTLKYGK